MAAYAALASLAQTTVLIRNQDIYDLSIHVEEKVRSIHEYVIFMLSFLEDFPEKADRWEGRIRDVAHKTQDVIDYFMVLRTKSEFILDLGKLKYVTEEIGQIAGQMMEERPALLPAAISSPSAPSSNDAVIGLEEDVMVIKERLCGYPSKLQVVPIVGMAGIGKTTLAKTVYEDQLILEHFDIRAWFSVSQDYTPHRLGKILLGLLDSMNLLEEQPRGEKIDESEEGEEERKSEMATRIYRKLKCCRRYLIVMDDVWSPEVLDDVRHIFPNDNNGSRIMLTTRLSDLAAYPDPYSPLHEMQYMDGERSWALLKLKVLADSHCPPDLEEVGKEIVTRCGGLPLAVVLIAGVLSAVSRNRASWEEIAQNVSHVFERELEEILSLSYTHLPHHLRPCFLYMGGFPEDESIHASTLVKLWAAEDFLKQENRMEEEADEYLEDLVKRNLVIVTSRKSNGKIKKCILHDTVRELCLRKAHKEEFLHVVDGHDVAQNVMIGGRRISLNHSNLGNIWGPTIRTILCFQPQNAPSWLAFLESNILVKVLSATTENHEESPLPTHIFQLFQLKYLALVGSFSVPSAISNLVNLQTLIIHPAIGKRSRKWREYENASHFSLPSEIWKMLQLRHIILHDLCMLPDLPDGSDLPPLQNLQTLLAVVNRVWNEKLGKMIPNVKKLGLVYTTNQEYAVQHLGGLLLLENLRVVISSNRGFPLYKQCFSLRGLPRRVKKLTLIGTKNVFGDMSVVGSFPNLEVLKLLGNNFDDGVTWETRNDEFPKLKYLLIEESHLRQWRTGSNPLPRLERLVIRSCRCLRKIPEGIGEILTLELIEVTGSCKRTLLESLEQIKEDQESAGNDGLQVRSIDSVEVQQEEEEEEGGGGGLVFPTYQQLLERLEEEKERRRRWRTAIPSEYLPASPPPPAGGGGGGGGLVFPTYQQLVERVKEVEEEKERWRAAIPSEYLPASPPPPAGGGGGRGEASSSTTGFRLNFKEMMRWWKKIWQS